MKGSLRFEGGKELAAALARLPQSVSKKVCIDALLEAADPMVAVARRIAPREPGAPDLADNIEARAVSGGKDGLPTVAWGPLKDFFYGYFLEFGTVRMSARPFMRPAFDSQMDRSLDILRRRLWEKLSSGL